MVIAASPEESRGIAVALRYLKAQKIAVEGNGAVEVGNLQMHVADGRMGRLGHYLSLLLDVLPSLSARTISFQLRKQTSGLRKSPGKPAKSRHSHDNQKDWQGHAW
jgi:hypothetical protein